MFWDSFQSPEFCLRRVAKQAAAACVLVAIALLAACGNNNNYGLPTATTPANTPARVLVSNQLISSGLPFGGLVVVNSKTDQQTASISTGGAPGPMVLSPDKKTTLVLDSSTGAVYTIDNPSGTYTGTVAFGSAPLSVVPMPDNATAYAAIRNTSTVSLFDYTKFSVTTNISVPTVRTLVLSHNGKALLAFSDDIDTLTYIDTSSNTPTTIAGFDRPVYAVFSSDDSKAYILSCGFECGGTAAKVTVLDIAGKAAGASVPVAGAEIGALDSAGTTLYVAGTCANSAGACAQYGGVLSVITASSLTVTSSVPISNGYHQVMSFGANNKLFIGSRTCDNVKFGCLSVYDTSAGKAVVDAPAGDVTGLQPINGRSIMYVIEGGELRIFDTSTSALAPTQIDILGKAIDAKAIDQ